MRRNEKIMLELKKYHNKQQQQQNSMAELDSIPEMTEEIN